MARAYSVTDLYSKNFKVLPFDGEWKEFIGTPELTGAWIISGKSGNGKTRLAVRLAKYMTKFGKVAYDSIEEGLSFSIKQAFKAEKMHEVKGKIQLLDKEPLDELESRLDKQRSPDIVIVDSIQFTGKGQVYLKKMIDKYRNKLFIFVSHAEGSKPLGRTAQAIEYVSNVKILVSQFVAYPKSRYGGNQPYTIWEEGANRQ